MARARALYRGAAPPARRPGAEQAGHLPRRGGARPVLRARQGPVRSPGVRLQLQLAQAASFHAPPPGRARRRAMTRVVVIGAGPAGLTAAFELARAGITDVQVLEASEQVGGLARSFNYTGNRIDNGAPRLIFNPDSGIR